MTGFMRQNLITEEQRNHLIAAGFSREDTNGWIGCFKELELPSAARPEHLQADAAKAGRIWNQGWSLIERLPPRSKRNSVERSAGESLVYTMAELCWQFCRSHRQSMYRKLTDDFSKSLRLEDLVWRAAELWPGLLPTAGDVEKESERFLMDKDGREIQQGMFIAQMLSDREIGTHLVLSMLEPTKESRERLDEFIGQGGLDLGTVRAEIRGDAGYIFFNNQPYLNAEDAETCGPAELAIDLILLHPELRVGVLRGSPSQHPKYKGLRIFSSGLNLTKLYEGKLPFLFYIVRELGMVNKIYRGLAAPGFHLDEPENFLEKPWIAVLDTFAIGGGCQLLLAVDYVLADSGAYFNLPARKEGIIPGCANLRLPRFMGESLAREAILFDKTFNVDSPEGRTVVNEIYPAEHLDEALEYCVRNAVGSGMVSVGANRKCIRLESEPLDKYRNYMATYAKEQAYCHLSEQLIKNLERYWRTKEG